MIVTLRADHQFGPTGPQSGDRGHVLYAVRDPDGEIMFAAHFPGQEGIYWLMAEHVFYPNTSTSETYYTTRPSVAELNLQLPPLPTPSPDPGIAEIEKNAQEDR